MNQEFNQARLTLARKRRGLTKKALADAVEVSAISLTAYEAGTQIPRPQKIKRLADHLGFPVDFFSKPDLDELPPDGISFRAFTTMTARERDQATSAGQFAINLAQWINSKFKLPEINVPLLRGLEPEVAAQAVRSDWGMGQESIRNVIHLLEANGIRVFSLAEECRRLDAFSLWINDSQTNDNIPYVFLNTMKSVEHSRMDAAHELGHLVLHWRNDIPKSGRDIELEANTFASAFLMPPDSIKANIPNHTILDELIKRKRIWGASLAALTYWIHKQKMISDWQYHTLFAELSRKGYRTKEPDPIKDRETSKVLTKVFSALRKDGISNADVARELSLPIEELNKLIFGLAITGLGGNGEKINERKEKPSLRLV